MIKLRDYQDEAIDLIYAKWRTKRKLVFFSQTGSGKTEVASYIVADCLRTGMKCVVIVRGRSLVSNFSDRLKKYDIDHSIFMANSNFFDPKKTVQVCSIDTLKARNIYPFSDEKCVVILDEAHKNYDEVFGNYKISFILGLTATPFANMHHYDDFVQTMTAAELRDSHVLVPAKFFCPHRIDTSSLKIVAGDFERKKCEQLVLDSTIVSDCVDDYIKLGEARPAICFAVSVEHSKKLRDNFLKKGIRALHVDATSSKEERDCAKDKILSGEIKIICNVDIFSTGWDCPEISCVILARPTQSLTWFLQSVGRGLRSSKNKENCIVLDNAGNVYRFGDVYTDRAPVFEKTKKVKRPDVQVSTCLDCYAVYESSNSACPFCLAPRKIKGSEKSAKGQLLEYEETQKEAFVRKVSEASVARNKLKYVAKKNRLGNSWILSKLKKSFSDEILRAANII